MAFYKIKDSELLQAENAVMSRDFTLLRDEHETYTYPVDGWRWFDTIEEANTFFGISITDPETEQQQLIATYEVKVYEITNILTKYVLESDLTDEQITELLSVYPSWETGQLYELGFVLKYDGKLYKVVQAHTSQSDWTPDVVPALFTKFTPAEVIAEWVQPTGAHDAYNIGDKVAFGGSTWESLIDANTYSPTAYPAGWNEL